MTHAMALLAGKYPAYDVADFQEFLEDYTYTDEMTLYKKFEEYITDEVPQEDNDDESCIEDVN